MLTGLLLFCFAFSASFVVAQETKQPIAQLQICSPQGCVFAPSSSNIIIGAGLKNKNGAIMQILPGQYSLSASQGMNLEQFLPPFATLLKSRSPGFKLSSNVAPFSVVQSPGFSTFSGKNYNGPAKFNSLPNSFSNQTISIAPDSFNGIAVYPGVYVAMTYGSANPTIFYDTAPLITLPSTNQPFVVIDHQLSTCQPPCTGFGRCIASAKCACANGFAGPSCELCASGFFGPACKPCPSPCNGCNQTTGLCLTPKASKAAKREQSICKCQNGQCHDDGNCSCLPGWTNATEVNGVTCAQCAPGFYSTSAGDCRICDRGCTLCENLTGKCSVCKMGYKRSQADNTKCEAVPAVAGDTTCPDGSYSNGKTCQVCSPSCANCEGPSDTQCLSCPLGKSYHEGKCVTVGPDGVCAGTNGMVVNNNKQMCDTCGSKCTACGFKNYSPSSTMQQVECNSCLTGAAPSNGTCETLTCEKGQFVSGSTCKKCSKSCGTCASFPENCLTCPEGQYLSGSSCTACSSKCQRCSDNPDNCTSCKNRLTSGKCVQTCPKGTHNVSGNCIPCHGDCAACSGLGYNECTECHPDRPVLSNNGRCLRTCSKKTQYFNPSTSLCVDCDPSCSSCSADGPSNCLACSNPTDILKGGQCSSSSQRGDLIYLGMDFGT